MKLEQLVRNMVTENLSQKKEVPALLMESEVRLAAIQKLKEIQAQLTQINFLDVVAVMRLENPLRKEVEQMETELAKVRQSVEDFVVANQFDALEAEQEAGGAVEGGEEEEAPEEGGEEEAPEEPEEDEDEEEKEEK